MTTSLLKQRVVATAALMAVLFLLITVNSAGNPSSLSLEQVRECCRNCIVVHQGKTTPLPNGIPTYTVHVLNKCPGNCIIRDIHLKCGAFSSARLINPSVFRRLGYNDCLLNDGRPLAAGFSISFQYANSFSFPMDVSSATCHPFPSP